MLGELVFALGLGFYDIDIPYLPVSRRLLAVPVSPHVTQHVGSDEGAKKVEYRDMTEEWKTNLMSFAILFHLLRAQHVSDINPLNTELNPICQ